jgi:hypothetical protein
LFFQFTVSLKSRFIRLRIFIAPTSIPTRAGIIRHVKPLPSSIAPPHLSGIGQCWKAARMKLTIKLDTRDKDGIAKVKTLLAALDTPDIPSRVKRKSSVPPDALKAPPDGGRDGLLALPVTELAVKSRVHHALMKRGYTTIGHIVPLTLNQIREVEGIGRMAAADIERALAEVNLR